MARRRWAGNDQPVDDQVAEADIQDRLALANALRQKSMAGAELPNVGGHLVGSPWARALSSVAQGVQGEGERKRAYGMAEDLATSKRERLAQALGGVGKDQTPDGMIEFGTRLLNDPATAEVGQFYIQSGQKAKEQAAAREAEAARWQHQENVGATRFQQQETAAERRHREDMAQRAAADSARLAAIQARGPAAEHMPAATIQEINYLRSLDALPPDERKAKRDEFFAVKRAQQVVNQGNQQAVLQPGAAPGAVAATLPINLAPNQTAQHAFDVKAAGKQGEAAASLASQKAKAPGIIDEAKSLLEPAPGGQLPTQSGVGSAVDRIGGWFGMSPPGATEAARLKVVGGNLTSLVPRFEGPQSDRDTQAYREMAGQIGDDTIPVPQRLAALKQVETLINGYGGPAKVFGGGGEAPMAAPAASPVAAPPPGIDPEDWKYLSPEEQAAFHQ